MWRNGLSQLFYSTETPASIKETNNDEVKITEDVENNKADMLLLTMPLLIVTLPDCPICLEEYQTNEPIVNENGEKETDLRPAVFSCGHGCCMNCSQIIYRRGDCSICSTKLKSPPTLNCLARDIADIKIQAHKDNQNGTANSTIICSNSREEVERLEIEYVRQLDQLLKNQEHAREQVVIKLKHQHEDELSEEKRKFSKDYKTLADISQTRLDDNVRLRSEIETLYREKRDLSRNNEELIISEKAAQQDLLALKHMFRLDGQELIRTREELKKAKDDLQKKTTMLDRIDGTIKEVMMMNESAKEEALSAKEELESVRAELISQLEKNQTMAKAIFDLSCVCSNIANPKDDNKGENNIEDDIEAKIRNIRVYNNVYGTMAT